MSLILTLWAFNRVALMFRQKHTVLQHLSVMTQSSRVQKCNRSVYNLNDVPVIWSFTEADWHLMQKTGPRYWRECLWTFTQDISNSPYCNSVSDTVVDLHPLWSGSSSRANAQPVHGQAAALRGPSQGALVSECCVHRSSLPTYRHYLRRAEVRYTCT